MTALPVEELLTPLSEGEPCGADLTYDPAFTALEALASGTPERHSGDTLVAAASPNWPDVHAAALALARRTRDLRVAVLLARAGARTQGLTAYAAGVSLVDRMLERYWDKVHPRLDESDGGDPTMRLNALAPLIDIATGLADLRASGLISASHPLTVRLVELAWNKVEPSAGEMRPTQSGIAQGLQEARVDDAALLDRLATLHATVSNIERTVGEHVGELGPDFKPLLAITGALAQAAAAAEGTAVDATPEAAATVAPNTEQGVSTAGVIRSRDDVGRTLGIVCEWIERHEPSNPAPLLIRRAQRLMSKSFVDLVRDLAPAGLSEVESIAGLTEES